MNLQHDLLGMVLNGRIDVIGTDHAPHPVEKKTSDTPASGIPALPFWPKGIQTLMECGIKEHLLRKITFDTANRLFYDGKLKPFEVEVQYNPSLFNKYGWNPFSRLS